MTEQVPRSFDAARPKGSGAVGAIAQDAETDKKVVGVAEAKAAADGGEAVFGFEADPAEPDRHASAHGAAVTPVPFRR
jgi:hypothetical protein